MTLTVALKDVDTCYNQWAIGISNDGRKVYAWGTFGLRIADAKGTPLGSYPTPVQPLFSPNTARFALLDGNELQIIELAANQVLYQAALSDDSAEYNLAWVDDDRFIYSDAKTVYVVHF